MQALGQNPTHIQLLEHEILEQVLGKKREFFGQNVTVIDENDSRYEEVNAVIEKLIERFPKAENGSCFIQSFAIAHPTLIVPHSQFKHIFEQTAPGSLFLSDVGLQIAVGPLVHPILGPITKENNTLTLRNIRLGNGPLEPNEHAALAGRCKRAIAINAETIFGAINLSPALKKTRLIADVTFGSYISQKDMIVSIETYGDEETTELIISLPIMKTKIKYDGTIAFRENGTVCNVTDLLPGPVTWIDFEHTIEAPFEV